MFSLHQFRKNIHDFVLYSSNPNKKRCVNNSLHATKTVSSVPVTHRVKDDVRYVFNIGPKQMLQGKAEEGLFSVL